MVIHWIISDRKQMRMRTKVPVGAKKEKSCNVQYSSTVFFLESDASISYLNSIYPSIPICLMQMHFLYVQTYRSENTHLKGEMCIQISPQRLTFF